MGEPNLGGLSVCLAVRHSPANVRSVLEGGGLGA